MSDTTGGSGVGHRHCYFCGVSTIHGPRRRFRAPIWSYQLTDEYLSTYPYIAEYSRHLFSDTRQETKAHDQKLCQAVQRLSGVLGGYMSVYNEAVDCLNQNLQVQKTKYIADVVNAITRRIFEIKLQLTKLEQSNCQFIARGLANMKLTTADVEFSDIPGKIVRPPQIQAAIDDVWIKARELKEKLEEEEKQRELEEQAQHEVDDWWDFEATKLKDEDKKAILTEDDLRKKQYLNLIAAQEKCRQVIKMMIHKTLKREMWEKMLLGTFQPPARLEVQTRAAQMIQKFLRAYFESKKNKNINCLRDELLGVQSCRRTNDEHKIKDEEIRRRRVKLRQKYEQEWQIMYEKFKIQCLNSKCDEIKEDYRDEIRFWFQRWYKEAWFFYDIPKANQGGSILILKEETPAPGEWRDQNQKYLDELKANKSKSPEQLKQEKKMAKKAVQMAKKEEAMKKKMEEKMLAKMMKNPTMHPGYKYPPSKETEIIVTAIKCYHENWDDLDACETRDVKEKFVKKIDKNNTWAEVKQILRPQVDDDMRNELKILKTALKKEYEFYEEELPLAAPQKFPKLPKQKPIKTTINNDVIEKMVDLVMKGFLKEYPRTTFEDFKGEPNFAGDDLRCNFKHALPYGGETRNIWWEQCKELTHGLNKILLVGPKRSGKTLLVHAMATANDAVLFELQMTPTYFGDDATVVELQELINSVAACAKAAQPAVIYIHYINRLFYSKVPPEEPVLNAELLKNYLVKKLMKKFNKMDKVTIIGSCIDPWLTRSVQLLKQFPTVVMMPSTTCTTTALILREWVKNNRMIPSNLDISCLAHVLQGYSFGYLQQALKNFLTADRIARIAAFGLNPQDIYNFILQDERETKVEYDKYLKWYGEKTHWGITEKKHLAAQVEFEALARKYAEKTKKSGKASAASSATNVSVK